MTDDGVIRVLVADDQDVVRQGICRILDGEQDIEVVGQARDGAVAVDEARRTTPGVALLDIRMPVLDGLGAARRILADLPATRVVILTTFDLDEYVYEALRLGAAGFLLKDAPADDIVRAVRVAAGGEAMIAPATTRRLIEEFARHRPPASATTLDELTEREREVLRAMARGLNNSEVGAALFISEGTVRTHVNRILAKLQVRDRLQAVVLAYETGLVRPGHTLG
jgi:DNA-binding NarL/FixJ family response regulator